MSTHTLNVDADANVIPPHTPYQTLAASLGVVAAPFSGVLAYIGATQGQGAALVAMASNWWLMPLMTAATWGMTTALDKARIFAKQRQTIVDLTDEIGHLRKDVVNLSASVESLLEQVATDKDIQQDLRRELADALAWRARHEQRTPNPDA